MKSKMMIAWIVLVLIFVQCTKEKGADETGELVRTETAGVVADLPPAEWDKSVIIREGTSDYPESTAISRSLAQGLVQSLSKQEKLKVHPVSARFSDEAKSTSWILNQTIRSEENQLYVSFNLHDEKGESVWSKEYSGPVDSLFFMEKTITADVSQQMGVSGQDSREDQSVYYSNVLVQRYIQAEDDLKSGDREKVDQAVESYKAILETDSTFIPAYIGLAESYLLIHDQRWDRNPVWLRLAQDVLEKAEEIEKNHPQIAFLSGRLFSARGDWKMAEMKYREALIHNPNLQQAWVRLGQIYAQFGLYETSLEVYAHALALDSGDEEASLGRAMILTGLSHYDDAENEMRRAIRLHPQKKYYHSFLALFLYYKEELVQARQEISIGLESPNYQIFSKAVHAMISAKQGFKDEALAELELEIKPYVGSDGSLASAVAAIYALLGRNGLAVEWLNKAVEYGYQEYVWIVNDPNFKGLRNDSRFQTILDTLKERWMDNIREYRGAETS